MALDTKQKRGSAIGVTLPFRQWLSEPSGALAVGARLSLLKLVATSASAPGEDDINPCVHIADRARWAAEVTNRPRWAARTMDRARWSVEATDKPC